MTRNDKDRHLAEYRDGLSFFARVNQYRYRLHILFGMRGDTYKQRLIEVAMPSHMFQFFAIA